MRSLPFSQRWESGLLPESGVLLRSKTRRLVYRQQPSKVGVARLRVYFDFYPHRFFKVLVYSYQKISSPQFAFANVARGISVGICACANLRFRVVFLVRVKRQFHVLQNSFINFCKNAPASAHSREYGMTVFSHTFCVIARKMRKPV